MVQPIALVEQSILPEQVEEQIKSIFFANSLRRTFSGEGEREKFYRDWVSYYLKSERESLYLATRYGEVIGYLTGCLDSQRAAPAFSGNTAFNLFSDLFSQFPAHLHINVRADQRGQGVGQNLISVFVQGANGVPGIHIITDPKSRNVNFYRRLGFDHEIKRATAKAEFLFMGKNL